MQEIESLYRQDYDIKVRTMSRILGGDYAAAEDVVQEAFTRALKFYPSYDPELATVHTWFNAILFNALRDYQKEKRGISSSTTEEVSPEDVISYINVDKTLIPEMIETIPNHKHRRILELFFVMGYTSSEISQIEDKTTVSNVTTIVNRFRERMKDGV